MIHSAPRSPQRLGSPLPVVKFLCQGPHPGIRSSVLFRSATQLNSPIGAEKIPTNFTSTPNSSELLTQNYKPSTNPSRSPISSERLAPQPPESKTPKHPSRCRPISPQILMATRSIASAQSGRTAGSSPSSPYSHAVLAEDASQDSSAVQSSSWQPPEFAQNRAPTLRDRSPAPRLSPYPQDLSPAPTAAPQTPKTVRFDATNPLAALEGSSLGPGLPAYSQDLSQTLRFDLAEAVVSLDDIKQALTTTRTPAQSDVAAVDDKGRTSGIDGPDLGNYLAQALATTAQMQLSMRMDEYNRGLEVPQS